MKSEVLARNLEAAHEILADLDPEFDYSVPARSWSKTSLLERKLPVIYPVDESGAWDSAILTDRHGPVGRPRIIKFATIAAQIDDTKDREQVLAEIARLLTRAWDECGGLH